MSRSGIRHLLGIAVVAFGCVQRTVVVPAMPPVPAAPPDSVPAEYHDTTRWVSAGATARARFCRTSSSWASDGDGLYLVRVPIDGTIEPLFRAISALQSLPQVSMAIPEMLIIGADP